MNIVEFVGFIITMFALVFLFGKQIWEEKKRLKAQDSGFEDDEPLDDLDLRQFMESINLETKQVNSVQKKAITKNPPAAPEEKKTAALAKHSGLRKHEISLGNFAKPHKSFGKDSENFWMLHAAKKGFDVKAAYAIPTKGKINYGKSLIKSLKSPKDFIVLHEILSHPKGF